MSFNCQLVDGGVRVLALPLWARPSPVTDWKLPARREFGGAALTTASEYRTLDVVKTDIASMAPPPPPRVAVTATAATATATILSAVATRNVDQLQSDLTRLLRAAQPNRQLTEMAADGSAKIPSLVAVFLLNQVGASVGRPKLVDLSRVRPEDLRSLGGVARLVHRTLHPLPAGPLAS